MTSFVLYILAIVISIQYVSSYPIDPAQPAEPAPIPPTDIIPVAPNGDPLPIVPIDTVPVSPNEALPGQQVDPTVITPIDTVPEPEPAAPEAPTGSTIPVCDGSQVIYAIPPSMDPITGMPNGPGLDAITLSLDGINTFLSTKIGVASDMLQFLPDAPLPEIIRSAAINPLTGNLVLLYQEIDPIDPLMNDPDQRLVIIPQFKLNALLVEEPALQTPPGAGTAPGAGSPVVGGPNEPGLGQQLPQKSRPGILGYELDHHLDLSELRLTPRLEQIPLAEIAFDCSGNLLGITMSGELVQMQIEAGGLNLEMDYIGKVTFEGQVGIERVVVSEGFVGLTYDFQTNRYIAVGGPMANTLVQFEVIGCNVVQLGNPIIITDEFNICPTGIVSIVSRGDNQYYVTCAETAAEVTATGMPAPPGMGLAVLELQGETATILPLNAAQTQALVTLPSSSGGAIISSIPSTLEGNSICFPRDIQSSPPMCDILPAMMNCRGNIQIQQVFPPIEAAPGAEPLPVDAGLVPPPEPQLGTQGGITVGAAPVNGQVGGIIPMNGGYGANGMEGGSYNGYNGYQGGQVNTNGVAGGNGHYGGPGARPETGSYGGPGRGQGTSFNGEMIPGTEQANGFVSGGHGAGGPGAFGMGALGEGVSGSGSGSGSSSGSSGSSGSTSGESGSGSSGSSASGESGSATGAESGSGSGSTESGESGESSGSGESGSGSGSDDSDSDDSTSDGSSGSQTDSGDTSDESGSGSDDDDSTSDGSGSGSDESGDDDDSDSDGSQTDSGDTSDESGDDDDDQSGDDDDDSGASDDGEGDDESSDGGSGSGDSMDGDGDESNDDDDDDDDDDDMGSDGAQSYGNDFNENGFVSAQEYNSNGNGEMISLSPTTLANLWGLAMIFLGINVTFLFVCYYRNGNCKKNQVTMDDDMDADIESL